MQLLHNPYNISACLSFGKWAQEWLDARKAVDAARERLERAKARKAEVVDRLVSRLAVFSETVPGTHAKFREAVEAALAAARQAEEAAENSCDGIAEPFEPVDGAAVEDFNLAVEPYLAIFDELDAAERELDISATGAGEAARAERAAFAAFREKVSLLPSHLADALAAVEEIRAASERSMLEARAFIERADAMRKQMGKKS